jgi:hypothetical protein
MPVTLIARSRVTLDIPAHLRKVFWAREEMSKPKNAQSSGNGEPKALSKVDLGSMSDDSADSMEEPERDEDRTPAEVARASEVMSKRTMKKVEKEMSKQQTGKSTGNTEAKEPPKRRGGGGGAKKGEEMASFQDVLNDFMDGLTIQQIAERHDLALDTVKSKLPKLQFEAKRVEDKVRARVERERAALQPTPDAPAPQTAKTTVNPGVVGVQTVGSTENTPNLGVHNPSVPPVAGQNPPSTYTVPAVPAGVVLPQIQVAPSAPQPQLPVLQPAPAASSGMKKGGADGEEEEGPETPRWLRHDGGELVNTIEMAIRGVQSRETP